LKTQKSLQKLSQQLDATNNALTNIKGKLEENSNKTIDFLKRINEGDETVEVPQIINLQNCLTELHNVMQTLNNKQWYQYDMQEWPKSLFMIEVIFKILAIIDKMSTLTLTHRQTLIIITQLF